MNLVVAIHVAGGVYNTVYTLHIQQIVLGQVFIDWFVFLVSFRLL